MIPAEILNMKVGELLQAFAEAIAARQQPVAPVPHLPAPPPGPRFQTLTEVGAGRAWPTEKTLRHFLNRNPPGFSKCVHRVGKRILIDADAFWEWVAESNSNETTADTVSNPPPVRRGRKRK